MHILLITDGYYPDKGGIAYTLKNLYDNIILKGHKLYIINPYYKEKNIFNIYQINKYKIKDFFKFFQNKTHIYFLIISIMRIIQDKEIKFSHKFYLFFYLFSKPKLLLNTISNISKIYPYLKVLKIDLIASAHSGDLLPLTFILARLFNKKVVSLAHGTDFLVLNRFSLKPFYLKYIDMFILNCNWTKRLMMKIHKLNEKKLIVIKRAINLIDLDVKESKIQLREEYNIPQNQFVILSVGRHIPRKNFDLIIKAVDVLKEQDPKTKIKFFLIGQGPMTPQLKNLTNSLKLNENVEFLGEVDTKTRNKFYKLSDVFIMPSKTEKNDIEGFGIVFLEANYYNVPAIGSYSGGIVDAIIDGETGFLINSNDLKDLVEKILLIYKNEPLKKKLGENGHNRVINEFTWDKVIDDFINVFKKVIYE